MLEKTLAIIKPHAVKSKVSGDIIKIIELNGFNIIRMKKAQLEKEQVKSFYKIHADKSFFGELVDFMLTGPVILMVLENENAISKWRDLMGATDPLKSTVGTLRKMFGDSISYNAVHGSDSPENAKIETNFFFNDL